MIIKGKEKEIELTFKSRQMIKISEEIGNQYDLEVGAYKGDIKVLAKMISILSDTLDYNDSLDFVDDLLENKKTIADIYKDIFAGINEKAFFTQALEVLDTPPMDMQTFTAELMEKAKIQMGDNYITEMIQSETSKSM